MIKIENVTKRFNDFTALNKISCEIPEGCIYGLVGSNGAGKSTLLRLMCGIYKVDSGSITIDNEFVYENTNIKNRIAFVPDDLYFLGNANMDRMAKLYASAYSNFDMDRFKFLLSAFSIDKKQSLSTFSKGMKRQAITILAVSCRPKYLFLDETFDGLDPVKRNLVKSLICKDVEDYNTTAILSSHSLRELEDTCDQLALLHEGGLVFESDIENLKTSLFKIQVAFLDDYDRSRFDCFEILHFSKHGSVTNMIIKGDREETRLRMAKMKPVILDILPLTLEEVFTYEMEALGYVFNTELLEKEGENNEK